MKPLLELIPVSIQGKLLDKRVWGRSAFARVENPFTKIQIWLKASEGFVSNETFQLFLSTPTGSQVKVSGGLGVSGTGEVTITVNEFEVL